MNRGTNLSKKVQAGRVADPHLALPKQLIAAPSVAAEEKSRFDMSQRERSP
eukprot:m.434515 g.434515  ORF g.434515 m.434515 type:complete len:51 (+) comp17725_c0_seq1:2571-2723(+)